MQHLEDNSTFIPFPRWLAGLLPGDHAPVIELLALPLFFIPLLFSFSVMLLFAALALYFAANVLLWLAGHAWLIIITALLAAIGGLAWRAWLRAVLLCDPPPCKGTKRAAASAANRGHSCLLRMY